VIWVAGTLKPICAKAMVSFGLIVLAWNGSATVATWGTVERALTMARSRRRSPDR